MLGIIFGVASVVAVISVDEAAKREMLLKLKAMGSNNIRVVTAEWSGEEHEKLTAARARSRRLNRNEAALLLRQCSLIEACAPMNKSSVRVLVRDRGVGCEVVGTTGDFLTVSGFEMKEGRFLLAADDAASSKVCVLEEAIRKELFPYSNAIGESVTIDHEPYRVVGVLKGKATGSDKFVAVDIKKLNRRIYIPLSTSLNRLARSPLDPELDELSIKVRRAEDIWRAQRVIEKFFLKMHNSEGVKEADRDFRITVALDLIKQASETQRIFDIVMYCSAGISLLVGGIGIMNIMLANVSERRREIGIRRAVGATQRDILKQFFSEALAICFCGGIMGIVFGYLLTIGISSWAGWETITSLFGVALSLSISLIDGALFGTFPAYKAAKLDPIEALMYE